VPFSVLEKYKCCSQISQNSFSENLILIKIFDFKTFQKYPLKKKQIPEKKSAY